jgi:hypothetical protein
VWQATGTTVHSASSRQKNVPANSRGPDFHLTQGGVDKQTNESVALFDKTIN